jgi:hypothetical protein
MSGQVECIHYETQIERCAFGNGGAEEQDLKYDISVRRVDGG